MAPTSAPTSLSAVPSTTSAAISFTPPVSDGGSAITNYQYSFNNSTWTALSPADATSPVTISGLTDGTAYTIYLRAVNAVGSGPASAGLSVTTKAALNVQYLVIAGGTSGNGVGGSRYGGGGGAGGYRSSVIGELSGRNSTAESVLSPATGTNFTVTVGGAGSNSVFSTITSLAGGTGCGTGQNHSGEGRTNGTAGQGFDGGYAGPWIGGGGGGAGANGGNASGTRGQPGPAGGTGIASSITGTSVTRAGGGGGSSEQSTGGAGGAGGGGAGASGYGAVNAVSGSANTGGGGGGRHADFGSNGNGGSGIVILKYPDAYTITIGAGLSGSTAGPSGGFKVSTFTGGTGNVSWA
jgi:hypothetical protein